MEPVDDLIICEGDEIFIEKNMKLWRIYEYEWSSDLDIYFNIGS